MSEGRRLGRGLLGYLLVLTAVITLVPFEFALPDELRLTLRAVPSDVVFNVVLFLPLGFLHRLTGDPGRDRSAAGTLLAGALASAAIETLQLFEAGRFPSPFDVLANAGGAWLGALLHRRVAHRLRPEAGAVGRLALELPLVVLLYLLIPLLWLNSLVAAADPGGIALMLLLGAFGAHVLGAVHRHYFDRWGLFSHAAVAAAGGLGFLVGTVPALLVRPVPVLAAAALTYALTLSLALRPVEGDPERRFEMAALRRAAPYFLAYVALLTIRPLPGRLVPWRGDLGLGTSLRQPGLLPMLHLLEYLAAFSLLGYAIAELRGRSEEPYGRTARWIVACAGGAALLLEGLTGFHPAREASLLRPGLVVGAALYGGWIYVLQRDYVKGLRGTAAARERAGGRAESVGGVGLEAHEVQR